MATSKKQVRKAFAQLECAVAKLNDQIAEFRAATGELSVPTPVLDLWQKANTRELETIEESLVNIL